MTTLEGLPEGLEALRWGGRVEPGEAFIDGQGLTYFDSGGMDVGNVLIVRPCEGWTIRFDSLTRRWAPSRLLSPPKSITIVFTVHHSLDINLIMSTLRTMNLTYDSPDGGRLAAPKDGWMASLDLSK